MYHRSSWNLIFIAMVVVVVAMKATIYPAFLASMLCFAMLAMSFNLLLGFVGMMSFGHAAFFGLAGYFAALCSLHLNLTPEVIIVGGALVGGVVGLAFGAITIRREGLLFAMITLALAQMVFFLCLQSSTLGRDDGLHGFSRGDLFGFIPMQTDSAFLWVVIVLFFACLYAIYRIVESPFGNILNAIRQNETRVASLGYDPNRYKLIVFVMSATIAGIAGATKALALGFVGLTDVSFVVSGDAMLMTLLGGVGTLFGPIIGAWILVVISFYLTPYGHSWVMMLNGLIFMASVLFLRKGILGEIQERLRFRF